MRDLITRCTALLKPAAAAPIDEPLWQRARARLSWIGALPPVHEQRLRALCAGFLARKTITPVRAFSLDPLQRLVIAALCCQPVLHLGGRWLRGWSQVIVYPDAFRAHRSHTDEATGVVFEGEEELAGEAWEFGPLVLSWADIALDIDEPDAGFAVVAHEIAHKLDALDGVLDGTPPLPSARRAAWVHDFQHAYDALVAQVDAGRDTAIDPYAASAPEEFFAVVSEYHFSAPDLLAAAMPAVAAHVAAFYAPAPGISAAAESAG